MILDLKCKGKEKWKEKWVDHVVGLNDVKAAIVMLGMSDGQTCIELAKFYTPSDEKDIQQSFANTLGIRHITFAVEDIDTIVTKLKKNGTEILKYKPMKTCINCATFVVQRELS